MWNRAEVAHGVALTYTSVYHIIIDAQPLAE